jgi:Mrp family chromosome partitioning ATPase
MGRVYNALLKAERVSDGDRPRPRPSRSVRAERAVRTAEHAPALSADSAPQLDLSRRSSIPEASVVEQFDFNDAIALSETIAASQHRRSPAPQPVPVVAAPAYDDAFVEPRTVRNVEDLHLAPHLAALHGKDRLACERYRTLGARLLSLSARRKLRTVLVTSSEEGEGKSTIASNLAWCIANPSERRVLLIDAHPQSSSSLNSLFGSQTFRGLIGVAEDRCQFADAAIRLNPNGLYLLMQGSIESTRERGSSGNDPLYSLSFERLFTRLECDFDFIIVDSPPILASRVTQRRETLADGTLFVVRAGHTQHNAVTEGLKFVPPDRQLGLVLNESDIKDEIKDEIKHGRNQKKTRRLEGFRQSEVTGTGS